MSKDEATKEVLSADELDKWIKTIRINEANLQWIAETGEINGSLLVELRRVIPLINEAYHQSKLNEVTDDVKLIQRTLSLLNSMILSGEVHTSRSQEMLENCFKSLEHLKRIRI